MTLEQKRIIGLDIGSYQIKIIKMGKKTLFKERAIDAIPKGLITKDGMVSEDLLAQQIKKMMDENNIRGKRCSLCLPSQHIITKVVVLPIMDKEVLKENIYYEMEDYLPLDLDNYIIDFKIMQTSLINNVEYWHILVTAVLEKVALSFIRVLRKAGLRPIYLDIPSNCLQKLLLSFSTHEEQLTFNYRNLCLVDIGTHFINIIIFSQGSYFVDKTIPLGNQDILVKMLNLENIDGILSESEVQTYLKQVTDEIMGVIRYFKNQIPENNALNNIILFGGGAMIGGFSDLLEREIGVSVTLFSDWTSSNSLSSNKLNKEELMLMGNAIGSTIRRNPL